MNGTIEISGNDLSSMERKILAKFKAAQSGVLRAMRDRFYDIVCANFGIVGVERPIAWVPLSPAYAAKVGRTYATLFVSGALESAIAKGGTEGDETTVSVSNSDCKYATAHQYGVESRNLPARPYFPIEADGEVLPWTQMQVREAAEYELLKVLS